MVFVHYETSYDIDLIWLAMIKILEGYVYAMQHSYRETVT